MTGMPPEHDGHHSWAEAAGRAAFLPARAAARAWRGPLEEAAEELLSSPEIVRVIDLTLAGPLPEQVVRSLVRNRVLERAALELEHSGEIDRLVTKALASDEMRRVLHGVASSPELRDAIASQTTGLAEEVAGGVRRSAARLDERAERVLRRPVRAEPTPFAGIVTRAIAFALDAFVTLLLFMSVVGMTALVGSLVGGLHPQWLVGVLLASGWMLAAGTYFALFWTAAGQTPGMRLLGVRVSRDGGGRVSVGRSIVRLVGLVLSIIPMFAGFVPVLFTKRRRGCADWLADTVVLYDTTRASRTDSLRDHAHQVESSEGHPG